MRKWNGWLSGCVLAVVLIAAGDFFGIWERTYTSKQFGWTDYVSA